VTRSSIPPSHTHELRSQLACAVQRKTPPSTNGEERLTVNSERGGLLHETVQRCGITLSRQHRQLSARLATAIPKNCLCLKQPGPDRVAEPFVSCQQHERDKGMYVSRDCGWKRLQATTSLPESDIMHVSLIFRPPKLAITLLSATTVW
jgi:hypothetical protein